MSGQTVASVHWRALDREGDDRCRLSRVDHGWLLMGHSRFRMGGDFVALNYVVRVDAGWYTLSADVAGHHGKLEVNLKLLCLDGQWRLNDMPQPQVASARDLDLSFTPATNLMPLRRLAGQSGGTLNTRAAWLRYPASELQPLEQTYRAGGSVELVSYQARQSGFATQLCVDGSGFATFYPGYWEGEVTHQTR